MRKTSMHLILALTVNLTIVIDIILNFDSNKRPGRVIEHINTLPGKFSFYKTKRPSSAKYWSNNNLLTLEPNTVAGCSG